MIGLKSLVKGILSGYITGFGVSIPLGPSGIESVNRSITYGFIEGLKVSIGAILADISYLIIINFGLFSFFNKNSTFNGFFWIISGIILIVFNHITKNSNNVNYIFGHKKVGGIFSGFTITFLNPMTPSLWLAISGTVMSVWRLSGPLYFFICFVSMILGSVSWFILLNFLATKGFRLFKGKMAKKTSSLLNYVLLFLGIVFILFGLFKILF